MKKLKLQIGTNGGVQKGFTGIDSYKAASPKILHEIEQYPYPFKDNQVSEVLIGYTLCGIKELIPFFNEMGRLIKKGGLMRIVVPYYASARAFQDPTHCHHFTEYSFAFYNKAWRKQNKFDHYPITCDFDIATVNHGMAETEKGKSQEAQQFAALRYWNTVHDMMATLKKR